jgi:hypothetical protein
MNADSTETKLITFILGSAIICATAIRPHAQVASAGPYRLEQTSIATGGATNVTAGSFAAGGTTGQAGSDRSVSAQSFTLYPGFWTPSDLAPTAAHVTIGGRALSSAGSPIYGARISITDQNGNTRAALSNPFGYYQFDDVEVGRGYVLAAKHKTYQFNPIFVHLVDEVANLDLIAL